MSRGSLDEAWGAIEKIRQENVVRDRQLTELKMESEACKIARQALDSDLIEMCNTLKETKKEVLESAKEGRAETNHRFDVLSSEIKELMSAHLIRKGAESAAIGIAKHTPKIIIAIVSATFAATVVWMSKP